MSSPIYDWRDISEMAQDIQHYRDLIDKVLLIEMDEKYRKGILEVEARSAYGEATVMFYYYIVRTYLAHPEQKS